MKKVVLKLDSPDEAWNKVMETVHALPGVYSIIMDKENMNLTVTGDVDPVHIVNTLRKLCHTEIFMVRPTKLPEEMKEEPKKEEPKKQEENKEPKNKQGENEKDQQKDKEEDPLPEAYKMYSISMDENRNACVIS